MEDILTPSRYALKGVCLMDKKKDPMKKAEMLTDMRSTETDPYGSYTGVPADPKEKPIQDADDL